MTLITDKETIDELGGNAQIKKNNYVQHSGELPKFTIRKFETGATRDTDENKPDYEGFLSPLVIKRFGEYMNKHRIQPDGNIRNSDNWQKGIPLDAYIKSGFRHFMDVWLHHREQSHEAKEELEEALCALLFNIQGYLHETLKSKNIKTLNNNK